MKISDKVVSIDSLLLDPNNYRLDYDADQNIYDENDFEFLQEIVQEKLEKEKLSELRESMRHNGFLELDRILVRNYNGANSKGKYVVVEGNRRTAALKSLIQEYHSGDEKLVEIFNKSKKISVLHIYGTPKEIEDYSARLMGIRHVSGPKRWTGFQSARLIYEQYNSSKKLSDIAALLGITSIESGRRYRGYCAFLQMKSHPVFGRKIQTKHYALLLEFLAPTKAARKWLDWSEGEKIFRNDRNLERVYRAITRDDAGYVEINNPARARLFLDHLSLDAHRILIEEGCGLDELPALRKEGYTLKNELIRFTNVLSSMDSKPISEEEIALIDELVDLMKKMARR